MKHLKNLLSQPSAGKATAAVVGQPSAHRRYSRLKHLALMLCFLLGSLNVWGDVSTLTFTAQANGSGTADDGASWTVTSDGNESNFDNTKGIHYGTSSAAVQYIKLTTNDISGTITKVVVNASAASGVTATASVTVGGDAFGGEAKSLTKSAADYTFEGSASGEIVVTITKPSSATKAIYCKSVAVTYSTGGTPQTGACAEPTFNPEDGETFEESIDVAISAEDGATIYYTTDGNEPTTSSSVYSSALKFTETTTVKAIAVKEGANNSAVASATYTKVVAVSGYSIDFENAANAYTDWTFNTIVSQQSVTEVGTHGGSYYGGTDGKASGSIVTKQKVANPGTITFYVSKESNNTTASSWLIKVSTDGETWTQVGDAQSASANINKGIWTEVTRDLSSYSNVYVGVFYDGTTAKRCIDDLSLEMASAVAKPTISGEDNFLNATTVTISHADADHIYYTTNGDAPTTGSTLYEGPFELNATATVKAIAIKDEVASAVAEKTFTKITPLTVAQALAATPAANKYVSGVVASVTEVSTEHGNATYTIKDADVENSIIIYRGKYLNNADFTTVDQIEEGDEVTVFGEIKKYSEVNQFTTGNYIVAMFPKARLAWSGTTAGVFEASLEGGNTFPTLTNSNSVTVEYGSSNTDAATINASTGEISLVGVGSTTITASFAGNPSFKANSVSYTLNVSSSVIKADISFECNGATSCPETMLAQSNLPSPLPTVTKAGKNFGGWFTTETFEAGSEAVAGAAVESTDAITLYAKWLDPYSVTEALSIINALADGTQTESSLYVAGIVSTAPTAVPSSGKLTFYISVNGEAENQLQAYNCKDLNNESFTAQTDIQEGDEVTIFGPLKKFIKSEEVIPEFNTGYLYSFNRPAKPTITADPAEVTNVVAEGVTNQTIALTYENIENYLVEVTLHDDAEGTEAFSDTWLTASVSDADNYATITYSVAANEGAARTAYMKVYAIGDDDKEATKIIAVSQEAYVAPAEPASLPFAFDEGRSDIATTQGMSQEGLDSDYGSSPKLKFNTTGDYVIINIASDPGKLTYDIKGNSFSGGTFKVQESADGVDYTDVAEYTELGETQSEEQTLLQATRFVKFIYTNKVNGNVALGNIAIAEYVAPAAVETPAFSPAGGEYAGAQSVTITCETVGAEIYYTTNGDDPTNESTPYTAAISVEETMTIKAIAYKEAEHSEIATATYTITPALTDYYEKVTSGDVAEGTYLIVYETGSLAFNGGAETLDASSNTIAVEITNDNKIGVTQATAAATFYIDPEAGTIQAANGKYIGQGSDANGMATFDNALVNTLSIDNGNAVIVSAGGAYLRYNATSGQERFRYFKSSSYTGQKAIQLYKLANEVIKPASGLAWDPAEDITLTVGDAFTAPELQNPNNIDAADITIASSNELVATVSEGVVSLVENATGTTTITATYTGETYKPITVSYKIKVNPASSIYVDKLNVTFDPVVKDAALPADKTITVTLNNVAVATATLGGTNPDAFSIDPATLTESGNITISVVSSATVANYSATLTISDEANVAEAKVVNLSFAVTDAAPSAEETPVSTTSEWVAATEIVNGMQVLIVGERNEKIYAVGAQTSNNRTAVEGSLSEGVFTPGENTMAFTVVAQEGGTYALQASNGKYLYAAGSGSGKNYLRSQDEVDDNAKWTLSVSSATANGTNTNNKLQLNNSSDIFSCYSSTQKAIQFYVPKPAVTPEPVYTEVRNGLAVGRFYTICLNKEFSAVRGATLWDIENGNNDEITLIEAVLSGNNAGRPYIFLATAATMEVVYGENSTTTAGSNNGLHGTFVTMTENQLDGKYILSENQLWYVDVTGGSANVTLAPYRAYLDKSEVPAQSAEGDAPARRRMVMAINNPSHTPTGIDVVNMQSEGVQKVVIDGNLYIVRDGRMYDTTGRLVK